MSGMFQTVSDRLEAGDSFGAVSAVLDILAKHKEQVRALETRIDALSVENVRALAALGARVTTLESARPALFGWQPIETAPRLPRQGVVAGDYAPVLVGRGTMKYPVVAFQHEDFEGSLEWYLALQGTPLSFQPTHWMPLPAPPPAET